MPVVPDAQTVLVHIPRNGGTRRSSELGCASCHNRHLYPKEYVTAGEITQEEYDFWRFLCPVRNSWDRLGSMYVFLKRKEPFAEFVEMMTRNPHRELFFRFNIPQSRWIKDRPGMELKPCDGFKTYRHLYDEKSAQRVRDYYAEDIELLGFTF